MLAIAGIGIAAAVSSFFVGRYTAKPEQGWELAAAAVAGIIIALIFLRD